MTTNKIEATGPPVSPEGPDMNGVIDLAHLGLEHIRQNYAPGNNTRYLPMRFSAHSTAPVEEPVDQMPSASPDISAQPGHDQPMHKGSPVPPVGPVVNRMGIYEPNTSHQPGVAPVPSMNELAAMIYGPHRTFDRVKGTLRHASDALKKSITHNRLKVIAGAAAVAVLAGGAFVVTKSLEAKDGNSSAAAGAAPSVDAVPVQGEPKPSSAPINLKTTLTAKNILGTTPVSVVGVNASGTEKVVYPDLDGKKHEITTFNGQQLSWSIAQGFEYYGVPETNKTELFTVTKEDDVTVITVDLKNYDLEVDPTFSPGIKNSDNTEDQFAMNLFEPGNNVPVSPENLDPSVYIAIQALTTKLPTTLDESKYVSPQAWLKLPDKDRMITAAKPITIVALNVELLGQVQDPKGACGADVATTMQQTLADNIKKNITDVLQRKGQDVTKYRIDVVGNLEVNALERLQTSDFGKLFQSALQAKNQFLQFNVNQLTCTVTPVSTTNQ